MGFTNIHGHTLFRNLPNINGVRWMGTSIFDHRGYKNDIYILSLMENASFRSEWVGFIFNNVWWVRYIFCTHDA